MSQQNTDNNQNNRDADNRDFKPGGFHHPDRHEKPLQGLFWGLVLIFLGVLFFAETQHWIYWGQWWQILLMGLGIIFLVDALVRYLNPETRHGIFGRIITGLILITIGAAFLANLSEWWPLILIVIGVAILARFFIARRQ